MRVSRYTRPRNGIDALSGDENMRRAYLSGDPYLTFAKQAGAVPADGTKATHPMERDLFKICALAVQYGMSEWGLGRKIGKTEAAGRELLRLHRQTFPRYWRWTEGAQACGYLLGKLWTVFGWCYFAGPDTKARTLGNFPCQANGAEMLRLACSLATERGVTVCAPVHDALLIEAPLPELDQAVAATQAAMAEASQVVLSGFELRSDAKLIRHPERYSDPRGARMWAVVQELLASNLHAGEHPTCTPERRCLHAGEHPSNILSVSVGLSLDR